MDVLTKEQRHKNMSAIHGKDTKPEALLRKYLWNSHYRYRKNWSSLPGKPDIVITKHKICIFIDSEFFHGQYLDSEEYQKTHRKYKTLRDQIMHGNNPDFWIAKIEHNVQHDKDVNASLAAMGWTVIRFWSKDVLHDPEACTAKIVEIISGKSNK
jgi:DNA mismatch endonuclease (patch repair protein)